MGYAHPVLEIEMVEVEVIMVIAFRFTAQFRTGKTEQDEGFLAQSLYGCLKFNFAFILLQLLHCNTHFLEDGQKTLKTSLERRYAQ